MKESEPMRKRTYGTFVLPIKIKDGTQAEARVIALVP